MPLRKTGVSFSAEDKANDQARELAYQAMKNNQLVTESGPAPKRAPVSVTPTRGSSTADNG